MDRSQKLSDTEYEIMEVLWNSEAPMSASQIGYRENNRTY